MIGLLLAYAVQRGWLKSGATRGFLTAEAAERAAATLPGAHQVMILEEALDLQPLVRASTLIAIRGSNPRVLQEAANHVKGLGEEAVYVLDVDEVPGLFYPPDAAPSEETVMIFAEAMQYFLDQGIEPLPIWRISHDAGRSIANAADRLGVECVIVGTTQRSSIWHLLRGNVLKELIAQLPEKTRVLIVN